MKTKKTMTEMIVRLEIEGDSDLASRAVKNALDAGGIQDCINDFPGDDENDEVVVRSATSEDVPTFESHDGIIHDHVEITGNADGDDDDDDGRAVKATVIAGDHVKDTIGVQLHGAHLGVSFGGTALEIERLGQLMIAAARDTMSRVPQRRAVRS